MRRDVSKPSPQPNPKTKTSRIIEEGPSTKGKNARIRTHYRDIPIHTSRLIHE